MSIILRNKPQSANTYSVTDVQLTGAIYNSPRQQTLVSVYPNDTRFDAVKIGDYLIPMRKDNHRSTDFHSFDTIDPLLNLRVVDKNFTSTTKTIVVSGDARKHFPGDGSPGITSGLHGSPDGYYDSSNIRGITVDKIKRHRKYRITELNDTQWEKFGNLYKTGDTAIEGRTLASIGTSFIALASGDPSNTEQADTPSFRTSAYSNGVGTSESPYYISGITNVESQVVNGKYIRINKTKYANTLSDIVLELRDAQGSTLSTENSRWTIWNPYTKKVYFEDERTASIPGSERFDSPSNDSPTLRDGDNIDNTPSVKWLDRLVSVPGIFGQYKEDSTKMGRVVEVAHFSSMIGIDRPLSNVELDRNFSGLQSGKLNRDGSQPIEGNLIINGSASVNSSLDVTDRIIVGTGTGYNTNTGLALGTKDLEVNNIRLSGVINDDALFRKYGVVSFPHSFLADYNTKNKALEPVTVLYFSNVDTIVSGQSISAVSNGKSGTIRRINSEYGYVMVSTSDSNLSFISGDYIVGQSQLGPILKVLAPADYILPGQAIRCFGLQQNDTPLATYIGQPITIAQQPTSDNLVPTATKKMVKSGSKTYRYKIAQMHKKTGKISELSAASNDITGAPSLANFDKNNFVELSGISRVDSDHAILVYRYAPDDGQTTYHLIKILDNLELSGTTNLVIADYGAYDKTQWSELNSPNKNFTYDQSYDLTYIPSLENPHTTNPDGPAQSGIKGYLPFVGGSQKYKLGWLDTTIAPNPQNTATALITSSTDSPSFFRIKETQLWSGGTIDDTPNINESLFESPGTYPSQVSAVYGAPYKKTNEIEIFFDNSRHIDSPNGSIVGGLQKVILDAIADGTRTVTLPGGTYYTKLLTLPRNFKFAGQSDRNTIIKSIPFLDEDDNTSSIAGGNTNRASSYGTIASSGKLIKTAVPFFKETLDGNIYATNSSSVGAGIDKFDTRTVNSVQETNVNTIYKGVFLGSQAYARALIEFDAKESVEVADIQFDGNIINTYPVSMELTGKSNYLMSGQLSKNITLKNITINKPPLGGLYGEEISELVMEGSTLKNGSLFLSDNPLSAGLYLPGSSRVRLTSNIIENFNAANDLTSNENTTMVGNIVKDTGSGILGYATSNFVHEGNLILGPSNEFIPVVDTLNSEYDQFNVNLVNEAGSGSSSFQSDIIQYLRDDSPLNLLPPEPSANRTGISITSDIKVLVGLNNQQYTLPSLIETKRFNFKYSSPSSADGYAITHNMQETSTTGAANLADGNIQVSINNAKVNSLKVNAGFDVLTTLYNSLTTRPEGEKLIGLVYDVIGTEYLYMEPGDTSLQYSYIKIDTIDKELTFRIDSNYSGLIAIGDRITFTVTVRNDLVGNLGNLALKTQTEQDVGGKPILFGYKVKRKIVGSNTTDIIVDIGSDSGLTANDRVGLVDGTAGLLTSLAAQADPSDIAGCKIGIRNTFSIAKGRIVI